MLFAIGTKVRLKHTGDVGVITEILGDGILNVFIQSLDTEIPVFEEDLARADSPPLKQSKPKESRYNTSKTQNDIPYKHVSQAIPLKNEGIQLAFIPNYEIEDIIEKYEVILINDTPYAYLFSLQLDTLAGKGKTVHGKIESASTYYLQDLLFDQLNDLPTVDFKCWQLTTVGTGAKQEKILKIKPKQFFKKRKTVSFLNLPVHLFLLINPKEINRIPERQEDLKTYTKKNVRPTNHWQSKLDSLKLHDVVEYANFPGEIDLHIEHLHSSKGKMSSAEKLRLQLAHFDAFIEKAIQLGVPRVFIIHGIGKGKLRDIIASRLIQIPEVKTFKNEYHPRYGWGATEVIF